MMIEKIFIKQGLNKVELDNYLAKELDKAGFTKSEIVKTPLVTRIVVNVTRPGLAIGKSGSNITQLTETIAKRFGIDNPQLEIREIERPELDAQAVANRFKALIERGFSWRSVVFKGISDIQNAGAQGVEIVLSGKLAGKGGRKKRVRAASGYMKKVGEQAKLVNYGFAPAYPKVGAIGIKVKIVRPETIFPDKEKIQPYIKRKEEAAAKAATEAAKQAPAEAEEKTEAAAQAKDEGAKAEAEKKTHAEKSPKQKQPEAKAEAQKSHPEKKAHEGKKEAEKSHAHKEENKGKEKNHEVKKDAEKAHGSKEEKAKEAHAEKKDSEKTHADKKEHKHTEHKEKEHGQAEQKAEHKHDAAKAEEKK